MDPSIFESDEFKQAVRKEVEAVLPEFLKQIKDQLNDLQDNKAELPGSHEIGRAFVEGITRPYHHVDS